MDIHEPHAVAFHQFFISQRLKNPAGRDSKVFTLNRALAYGDRSDPLFLQYDNHVVNALQSIAHVDKTPQGIRRLFITQDSGAVIQQNLVP
jgi:hypothetical protein